MSTPNKYQPETNVQPPRCPHCKGDLVELGTYQWTTQIAIGLSIILAVCCPHADCRALLQSQIMIIPHAQEQGSIVAPH